MKITEQTYTTLHNDQDTVMAKAQIMFFCICIWQGINFELQIDEFFQLYGNLTWHKYPNRTENRANDVRKARTLCAAEQKNRQNRKQPRHYIWVDTSRTYRRFILWGIMSLWKEIRRNKK